MHGASEFLTALTIVLVVAGVTTVVFARIRQPVVLGYILAGLIIGPHVPIPLVADREIVLTLSELGVILLMFGLGLEFSVAKLFRAAPTAGVTALIQCSVMLWLGFVAGRLLGWTTLESIFAGAIVAVSSTTIIAKAFDEQRIGGRLREFVVAILIVEDLIAVLLMALLTAVASGAGLSAGAFGATLAQLLAFLVGVVAIGMLVVPRAIRAVVRFGRPETILVAAIGCCFAVSLLALELGYSVALGAFLAGVLVAESGEARRIEELVAPVRDVFAAIFFVSVGMIIDPAVVVEQWAAVVVFTLVVVVGKVASVAAGAFLTGAGTKTAVAAGMSLAQIGEFSFIIASLGLALGAIRDFLYPVAIAVSAITTLITPWLIRASGGAAGWVDRKLPRPLQTFVTLYESWIERVLSAPPSARAPPYARRLARILLLDVLVVTAIVIAASLSLDWLTARLARETGLPEIVARGVVIAVAAAAALPFCVGILRTSREHAVALAELAVPQPDAGATDVGRAARRMLQAALRLAGVLAAGLPLVALTQPFLPGYVAALALGVALAALAIGFWRTATDLEGHVKAAAQVFLEALAAQSAAGHAGRSAAVAAPDPFAQARELLPGLGEIVRVEIPQGSRAAGRSLAELAIRGSTGATVLAIERAGGGIAIPDAQEALRAGDVVALAGSQRAVEDATRILREPSVA
jgi:monovalent cation:H+ antiporter-2, CPA2 family